MRSVVTTGTVAVGNEIQLLCKGAVWKIKHSYEVNLLWFLFHGTFQMVTITFLHASITIDSYRWSHACTFLNDNDNVFIELNFSFYPTSGGTFQLGLQLIPHYKFYDHQCSC